MSSSECARSLYDEWLTTEGEQRVNALPEKQPHEMKEYAKTYISKKVSSMEKSYNRRTKLLDE